MILYPFQGWRRRWWWSRRQDHRAIEGFRVGGDAPSVVDVEVDALSGVVVVEDVIVVVKIIVKDETSSFFQVRLFVWLIMVCCIGCLHLFMYFGCFFNFCWRHVTCLLFYVCCHHVTCLLFLCLLPSCYLLAFFMLVAMIFLVGYFYIYINI